mmetsp:Transcript_8395/g.12058  ORF Transcript_8395/g.12058 Transcript_8395/m.12058 type:complete len:360 (+) Transcript_8395:53-1132(+)
MFRKPKKKPSALRTSSSNGGVGGGGAKQTKKRPRQTRDSSSDEDNNNNDDDDGDTNNTSDLLEQIRQERTNNDNKKSKTLLNTSGTIKHRKKSSHNNNNMMHQYKSSNVSLSAQEMATRTAEYHPANKDDTTTNDNDNNDAIVAQNAALPSLQTAPTNPFHAGPLRATTFVRTTARFDYQPDICKDYKETGFCGFGDTCIYLHDRGDTKSGWQMEQEYEEKKRREEERKGREMERFMNSMMCGEVDGGDVKKKKKMSKDDRDDYFDNNQEKDSNNTTNDGIPYACHICRGPFQNPVVTTCGHYFCEACMQSRIREENLSTCPICQKDTHGVLNHPQKLVAKKRRLVGRDGTWEEYLAKK